MEQQLIAIRDQQRTSWNQSSPGWKKWDHLTMNLLHPMGDAIIRFLNPQGTDLVLDVASGTGEPGLTIASMLHGGKVVLQDLAEEMLVIAQQNARQRGITNVETLACDVSALPFADHTFDAISCRMGFMFFPDMYLAAQEMVRVLKPGGRIAASVWNMPQQNFWIAATTSIIQQNMTLPAPPPGAPGMFRCAQDGLIADLFAQVGLKNISQEAVFSQLSCQTADTYWHFMSEVVGPVVSALSQADHATKTAIQQQVYQLLEEKYPDGQVVIGASAWVITAER